MILGLFVIMDILLAMIVFDIIGVPFRFFRHELQKRKDLKKTSFCNCPYCDPNVSRFQRNLLIMISV